MILIFTELYSLEPAINKYLNGVTRIIEGALTLSLLHRFDASFGITKDATALISLRNDSL